MKVLYLFDAMNVGGLEKSMLEIVMRLKNVQPIFCHIFDGDAMKPEFLRQGFRVIPLKARRRWELVPALFKLIRLITHERPCMLHLGGLYASLLGRTAGRWLRIPVIDGFTNEPYTARHYADTPPRSRWKLKALEMMDRLTMPWVDHFISVSRHIRNYHVEHLGATAEKISVVYRGRSEKKFSGGTGGRAAMRARLGVTEDVPVLINVARLIPRKGLVELLEAVPLVKAVVGPMRLILVGDGHFKTDLKKMAVDAGIAQDVFFAGLRNDVPDVLRAADVFVFPSRYEGLPGALVEAMFAGCAIVASDIPVHREILEHDKTALLVSLKSPQGIADAVISLLTDPEKAEQMGRAARNAALKQFRIAEVAAQYETIYKAVLAQSGSACRFSRGYAL